MKMLVERFFDVYTVFYGGQGFRNEEELLKKGFSTRELAEKYIEQEISIRKNYIGHYKIKTRDIVLKEWD